MGMTIDSSGGVYGDGYGGDRYSKDMVMTIDGSGGVYGDGDGGDSYSTVMVMTMTVPVMY